MLEMSNICASVVSYISTFRILLYSSLHRHLFIQEHMYNKVHLHSFLFNVLLKKIQFRLLELLHSQVNCHSPHLIQARETLLRGNVIINIIIILIGL